METIECACGCGEKLTSFDNRNRPRKYIRFHYHSSGHKGAKTNKNPDKWEKITCRFCSSTFDAYKCFKRRFCSLSCKAKWNSPKLSNNIEYAEKMRCIALRNGNKPPVLKGQKHWKWRGGITSERNKARADEKYRKWRIEVFRKDYFTCQKCGTIGKHLHAHHHKSFSQYPALRYNFLNGITLCESCHLSLHGLVASPPSA